MTIHRTEYIILAAVLKYYESLKNLPSEYGLSHSEILVAANRLFQNGDILAFFRKEDCSYEDNIILTESEIQKHLDGELPCDYYLSSQGAARWESLSSPNWNQYFRFRFHIEESYLEIICPDRELIEEYINSRNSPDYLIKPSTKVYKHLPFWKATYWKILPNVYQLTCEYEIYQRDENFNLINNRSKQRHLLPDRWYKEPKLDDNPENILNNYQLDISLPILSNFELEKIQYLILEDAVIFRTYSLSSVAYSRDISHKKLLQAAISLFEQGYIKASVYAEMYDYHFVDNVVLTSKGIQDHLDKKLNLDYYLTPEGGAYWEKLSNPDWDRFFIINIDKNLRYPQGILGAQQKIVKKLFERDCYLFMHKHIPHTETWQIFTPWSATYWKTLPQGYCLSYQYEYSNFDWEVQEKLPLKLRQKVDRIKSWYAQLRKWYTNPYLDEI
jgi:hypothetical protein